LRPSPSIDNVRQTDIATEPDMTDKPRIAILYCTQCNWLLRAAWMAQELLSTFGDSLGEVALIPGTGGNFEIHVGETLIWERKRDGGFPGPKELKQRIRDVIEPGRDLGHTDRT
jgi:selenoprotein W-related protein